MLEVLDAQSCTINSSYKMTQENASSSIFNISSPCIRTSPRYDWVLYHVLFFVECFLMYIATAVSVVPLK